MPIYEYECLKCKKTFDKIQKFSDPLLTECPSCGGDVQRLMSAPAFILKGDGWYTTDYPSADRKKGLEADKKAAAPTCAATCDKASSCNSK